MTFVQHLSSAGIGFIASASAVQEVTTLPQNKGEIIALVSAVLVQTALYGISKFFNWLKKKNEAPAVPAIPVVPATPPVSN